jgi:hypothetical protein
MNTCERTLENEDLCTFEWVILWSGPAERLV